MMSNNEAYWGIAMKFFNLDDKDVNKLKKDIDDRNSTLYQIIFTWNELKRTGEVKGLHSFKKNFTKFFGLDSPTDTTRSEHRFWNNHIDEINARWDTYSKGNKSNVKGDNE